MPPHGENPADNSFWMINAQEPEEIKFAVTNFDKDRLYMTTPYWKWVDCWYIDCLQRLVVGHQHAIYDPATSVKEAREIKIEFCREPECPVQGLHAHQGHNDDEIVPIEVPHEMAQHVGLETTQNLSIMKQPKVIKEEDLPIPTTEEEHRTMFINKSTAFQCVIITTQWRKARCTKEDCPVEEQHAHYIHDDEVAPQGQMVRIRLPFCQDTTCEDQPDIHVHQSDGLVITVEIPKAQADRLRKEWNNNSISIMVEKLGTISTIVDERANEEHIAEQFVYGNTECPNYYVEHLHYFNVDPNFPHFPITPTVYQRMLDEGLICEWQ